MQPAGNSHAVDPNVAKRQARIEAGIRASNSFAKVAEELIEKKTREGLAEPTLEKMRWFVKLLGTDFGKRPVTDITPHELLHELRKHERRGRLETAKLLRSFASRVFRYAVATARAERDPAQLLVGALTTAKVKHFPAITDPVAFAALLRAIEDYQGDPAVIYALKLTPHVFQRPGEIRQMEWAEVDFDKAVWVIPPEKMKMREPHAVPLSRQSLAILADMRSLSGSGRYAFAPVTVTGFEKVGDFGLVTALADLHGADHRMLNQRHDCILVIVGSLRPGWIRLCLRLLN